VTAIKNSLKHFQLQEVSAERARMELEKGKCRGSALTEQTGANVPVVEQRAWRPR
jgi:hypothetical protein